jgi:hypothetical protein
MRTLMKKGRLALPALAVLCAIALPFVTGAATAADSGLVIKQDTPAFDVYGDATTRALVYVPEGLPLILLGAGLAAIILVARTIRARKRSRKP